MEITKESRRDVAMMVLHMSSHIASEGEHVAPVSFFKKGSCKLLVHSRDDKTLPTVLCDLRQLTFNVFLLTEAFL